MPPSGPAPHAYIGGAGGSSAGYPQQNYDTSGQVAPPGMKPRVTATLWEDEGSMCFQVEAKGVCVARRDGMTSMKITYVYIKKQTCKLIVFVTIWLIAHTDNHMINGTKLLNVAGMTRGRRDGILKSEKLRNVVKIGPMHLKGVWYVIRYLYDFQTFVLTH